MAYETVIGTVADRDRLNVKVADPPSSTTAGGPATLTVRGAASSSRIMPVAVVRPRVAAVADESTTWNVSSASTVRSPRMPTETIDVRWPARKLIVPVLAT